ncbi:hypothetical protein ACHQM5_030326 [Ranunculus cassubicifolius]
MDLWQKIMVFPMRRVWCSVSTRVKARKNGGGLLKLHNDVQTCEYQDVQIMWEMLKKTTEPEVHTPTKRKQKPFWRVFVWSNNGSRASSPMKQRA